MAGDWIAASVGRLEIENDRLVTPTDFARAYGYSRDQAAHLLRVALNRGSVKRVKQGRTFGYTAPGWQP